MNRSIGSLVMFMALLLLVCIPSSAQDYCWRLRTFNCCDLAYIPCYPVCVPGGGPCCGLPLGPPETQSADSMGCCYVDGYMDGWVTTYGTRFCTYYPPLCVPMGNPPMNTCLHDLTNPTVTTCLHETLVKSQACSGTGP